MVRRRPVNVIMTSHVAEITGPLPPTLDAETMASPPRTMADYRKGDYVIYPGAGRAESVHQVWGEEKPRQSRRIR